MDIAALQSIISTASAKGISNSTEVQSGADAAPTQTSKDVYESKLADIASRYDVRSITPRQVEAMAGELLNNGFISILESGFMTLHYYKPADYIPGEFHTGVLDRPDEARDMLADFKYMASYQPTTETTKNVQNVVDSLELIESLSHNKSTSGKPTVNAQNGVDVQAAAKSYNDAISKTTADAQSVVNVLEALASHSQKNPVSVNLD